MPRVTRWIPALLLAGLPALHPAESIAQRVPTPAEIIGFELGSDYKLADYGEISSYFRALAEASDRVVLEEIGRSTLGKPLYVALISSEDNLRNREHYREISERLALTRGVSAEEAPLLADQGRAIVWIDGGLHATEVAHGQFTPELAYHVATDESAETRRIRDNVILVLMINMNPDGLDVVVNWYEQNVGTEFETSPTVELYHPYVGHDNNRDWYMFTQVETQAVARQLYQTWFPQIVYNHHQSGPFPARIWVPPFENPVNPNLDPYVVTSINHLGEAMKRRFAKEGKPGVVSGVLYDMWWNGSMRGAPDFHNMLGFLTETALYRYATPHCYEDDEIPASFNDRAGNIPADRPTTQYPDPWEGGCWHLKDPMEYMMTASLAVLDQAARFREDYLVGIYETGRRQIVRGENSDGGPFAYIVDVEAQRDRSAAVELLRTFRLGGIEIRQADAEFIADGNSYPKGTYVIPPQAFRPYVVDLMEPKAYPDRRQYPGGPPEPPYDMTGYELGIQTGVAFQRAFEPFPVPPRSVGDIPQPAGNVAGTGSWGYVLAAADNRAVTGVMALLGRGARVYRSIADISAGGATWPTGSFVVTDIDRAAIERTATEEGLRFASLDRAPQASMPIVRAPRIGLYKSYRGNMPEGWTRWVLERYRVPYENLSNEDIREGDLARFDVIVLPDEEASAILDGWSPGQVPPAYVGGLGPEGGAQLRRFVTDGGWLVALDHAADFAIEQFDLPVRNEVANLTSSDFFVPGSLINLDVDGSDPLAAGMPDRSVAFFVQSQAFALEPGAEAAGVDVYARYAEDYLASGWAHGGAEHLAGRPAALRVPSGNGQVVLIGFEPHFRGQPLGTFKMLFAPLFAAAQANVVP